MGMHLHHSYKSVSVPVKVTATGCPWYSQCFLVAMTEFWINSNLKQGGVGCILAYNLKGYSLLW